MGFPSVLLVNLLLSLCMKITNSVIVVGLSYGFMTTFSTGPSFLLLLRALVMEEGNEKKVAATTGFLMGQLMIFISTYYAPLHLALSRPHTITVLAVPCLFFHFCWTNHKDFFEYESTTRKSMRNFSIQCVFLNHLIFPFFNHFILPSSMLARLVNISMFRCNNKMLFVTSGFVGWLIGQIFFIKLLGLVIVWMWENRYLRSHIRYNRYTRYIHNYFISELINYMTGIFTILLFSSFLYSFGRTPSPIFTKKLLEVSKIEEEVESEEERDVESEEERDVEIETASEMKGTNQEQEGFTDPSLSFFSEEKADPNKIDETEDEFHFRFTETGYKNRPVSDSEDSYLMNMNENHDNSRFKIFDKKTENKDLFFFNTPLVVTLLFDLNRWNEPFRYIKNDQFEGAVRKEMSQYFFDICQSDGKERISFTYPPSLSIFLEMIKRRISPHTLEKSSSNELDNPWVYKNKQKVKNFNNEFLNRIEALDKKKKDIYLDVLETRTRLCNDASTKEYLSQRYDPFLNGSYRRTIYKSLSPLKNFIEKFGINRIHGLLLPDTDYHEFEQKINRFDKKPLSTEIVTDANGQKISRKSIRLEEISKKVPVWSYKLITELEQDSEEYDQEAPEDHEIRTRNAKRIVIFTAKEQDLDPTIVNPNTSSEPEEMALMRFSHQSDFRRGLIKGSMRFQRRKMGIWLLYQVHADSHLFLDKIQKFPFLSFLNDIYSFLNDIYFFSFNDISRVINRIFRNWGRKGEAFKTVEEEYESTKQQEQKEIEEQERIREEKIEDKIRREQDQTEVAESWDNFEYALVIRSVLLLTQSFFRKYILFPSCIIAKNLVRILLLQRPEWSEDFQEWEKEMHIICTYSGLPLSETEFPRDWLMDGIQIKILFPFRLKPWQNANLGSYEKDLMQNDNDKEGLCFLTVWGLETDRPFGFPRKGPPFFKPIFKELVKKMRKLRKDYLRARRVLTGKRKSLEQVSKETNNWVLKSFIFIIRIKIRIKKELSKVNPIRLFRLFRLREVEVYESSEIQEEKDSIISNQIIHESFNQITSPSWKNSSVTERKRKDLTDRRSTIRNQIERITKEKKKVTPTINNLSPNKTSSNAKRFEKWQILKRRTAGLIAKLPLFFKSFIQRIYTDIFLSIMNISRMNTELFVESTKSISNNEGKQEKIHKKKKNPIPLISTIKKALDYISNSQIISHLFDNLSCVSQAYVFYKFSHQLSNSYKSVLQHQGSPFFLKPEIKAPFETQRMGHSSYEMNHWKTWLRGLRGPYQYQYDFSHIRWSRLIPEKWRNTVHQRRIDKNENFSKCHSKDQLIDSKKQKQFESLSNQKENFLKDYRYDLLSYQFLNYENKRECCFYRSPFQGNTNQEISYKTAKETPLDMLMLRNIPINNYLGKVHSLYMEKTALRKYLDSQIFNCYLRQKVDIQAWITIDTNRNQKTQIRTNNSEIIHKKDLFDLMIPEINPTNSDKGFFDWMGMNEKMLKHPISNEELWFFPEFVLLYNAYKTKPWFIPSQLLLLNWNRNRSTEKINDKEKGSFLIASKHQDIEENYARSDRTKEKEDKTKVETEIDFFLKHYFLFQLDTDDILDDTMIDNIQMYCLLLRLKDPAEVILASAERRELNMTIMAVNDLTYFMQKGAFSIEPIQLSGKKDGQFLMYQTIGTSLVHKSKQQTNPKYQEQRYVSKNHFDEAISAHDRISRNRDKKHFDLLVPENILSFRHRRKFRILISLNSKNRNDVDRNPVFWNGKNVKNSSQVSHDNNHLDREKNQFKLMKSKHFLWPNSRLEDLACMNRYWFDTNNGSRFSMLRLHLYPRLKIRE